MILNSRQAEILEHLATGARTSRIAAALFLSPQAVSYHITQLLVQFEVESRTGLVARAYHYGVLDVNQWPPRVSRRVRAEVTLRPVGLERRLALCRH
jgi:DNA-binding CsgD family transcriptional regulator